MRKIVPPARSLAKLSVYTASRSLSQHWARQTRLELRAHDARSTWLAGRALTPLAVIALTRVCLERRRTSELYIHHSRSAVDTQHLRLLEL